MAQAGLCWRKIGPTGTPLVALLSDVRSALDKRRRGTRGGADTPAVVRSDACRRPQSRYINPARRQFRPSYGSGPDDFGNRPYGLGGRSHGPDLGEEAAQVPVVAVFMDQAVW